MKTRIVLLFGGKSPEHEVSVRSACSVYNALDRSRYDVLPVAISKSGTWLSGPSITQALLAGRPISNQIEGEVTLLPDPNVRGLVPVSAGAPFGGAESQEIAAIIPVLHGRYGEDGTIQGLLEMANLPYVGCGVIGSALGMDKAKQKEIFAYNQLPIARFASIYDEEWLEDRNAVIHRVRSALSDRLPLFVKPSNTGSSVGISKVKSLEALSAAINDAFRYDSKVVIEEGLENIREIEVSVLGNLTPRASVCGEIVPCNEFYDYNAKYIDDRSELHIPAAIPAEIQREIQAHAVKAFRSLECRGLGRVDFFLSRDPQPRIWLNEINTMPGFTSISMYPKLWEASGLGYQDLIEELIRLAREEWARKQRIETSI